MKTCNPQARSTRAAWNPALLVFPAVLGACGPEEGGSGPDASDEPVVLRLEDDHNYRFESSLSIPVVETASGVDLDICWTDVERDLLCHEVDPAQDIDNVALLRFGGLTHQEIEELLVATELSMSDVSGYLAGETDGRSTCGKLSDLTLFGTQVDVTEEYVEDTSTSYMLVFTTGTVPGVGSRTMVFIDPKESSTTTQVDAPPGCGGELALHFQAELSPTHLEVPNRGPWRLDWGAATVDGAGHPLERVPIDAVLVGFYADLTPTEVEAQILDLEIVATHLWELEVTSGHIVELDEFEARDGGEPFSGFDQGPGTWILGLMCRTCQNPAPVVLAVLEPKEAQ